MILRNQIINAVLQSDILLFFFYYNVINFQKDKKRKRSSSDEESIGENADTGHNKSESTSGSGTMRLSEIMQDDSD